ncbi:MAG: SPOR domain-containing protein [Candidatus Omnitrophota bacterium]
MEKEQLELFSGSENTGGGETKVSGAFLQYLRAYEKIVLFSILLLAVAVVSFIAGVEKGKTAVLKRLAVLRQEQLSAGSARTAVLPQAQVSRNAAVVDAQARTSALPSDKPPEAVSQAQSSDSRISKPLPRISGKYTVQLASYRSREQALKDARLLQKRGLAPAVIYMRPFYVLCSGSFQDKRTADLWRLKIKKQYRDCYVRRL